jgi:hypothetical protein
MCVALSTAMRSLLVPGLTLAVWSLSACSSSSSPGTTPDAATTDDASADDGATPVDSGPDGTANTNGDAGDAGGGGDASDASDANACAPVVQSDAGAGQCPAPPSVGGAGTGQVLLYPCGVPAALDLDGGATADAGWAADGGHVFACMTLCNDITSCYVTPADAGAGVLVTCCP